MSLMACLPQPLLQMVCRPICFTSASLFKPKHEVLFSLFTFARNPMPQRAVLLQAPGAKQVMATPIPPASTQNKWRLSKMSVSCRCDWGPGSLGPRMCMPDSCMSASKAKMSRCPYLALMSAVAAASFQLRHSQAYLVLPPHCIASSLGCTIRSKQLHSLHCCRSTLEAAIPWRWALTTGCGPLGTTAKASWAATLSRSAAPPLFWCRACQTALWCNLWLQVGR